jgi:hypothetical protein
MAVSNPPTDCSCARLNRSSDSIGVRQHASGEAFCPDLRSGRRRRTRLKKSLDPERRGSEQSTALRIDIV